jgi:hypothetical protein
MEPCDCGQMPVARPDDWGLPTGGMWFACCPCGWETFVPRDTRQGAVSEWNNKDRMKDGKRYRVGKFKPN